MFPRIGALVAVLAAVMMPLAAKADYPERVIEIIVPNPPGGSTDLSTRLLAQALQEKWGVPVRAINMPGGAQSIALTHVMQAAPDGYTIFSDGLSGSSLLANVVKELPFKVQDRSFIAYTVQMPMVLAVPATSPHETLDALVAAVAADPASITWGFLGGTGVSDLAMLKLFRAAGVDSELSRPVVSTGGAEIAVQLAGGHIEVGVASPASFKPYADAGQIRILAILGNERSPNLPDVPSAIELGRPELVTVQWNGFSGPPNLPEEISRKWHAAIQEAFEDPEVQAGLTRLGLAAYPKEFGTMAADVEAETDEIATLLGN